MFLCKRKQHSSSFHFISRIRTYSWCFWYVRVGAHTKGGFYVYIEWEDNIAHQTWKISIQNILSLAFDTSALTHTNTHCLILSYTRFMREMLHCVHFDTKEMGVSMWQKQKIAHFIDRFRTVYALSQWCIARDNNNKNNSRSINIKLKLLSFRWICRSTKFYLPSAAVWRHETRVLTCPIHIYTYWN